MALDFNSLLHGPVARIFGEQGQGAKALPLYTPPGGAAFEVDGVFDSAYVALELMDGTTSNTLENTFGAALSAFKVPPVQNGMITIPRLGNTYYVKDVQPDGHGWVLLKLIKK
ncbi:hypothetical protein ACNE9Y_24695 [Pseudomonas sp. NY11226]|uniref:head-tail joining protein n=1 Tax=Pseudomonas sp. NY11226 TaxID=3400362 RepID=UPI003A863EBE